MDPREQVQNLVETFWAKGLPSFIPRSFVLPEVAGKIVAVIGMRRSGKTYCLFEHQAKLLKNKVKREQILYLNFEDERLLPLDAKAAGKLIDAYFDLYPDNHERTCYIFLDEIQQVDGWPSLLRRLLDSKNIRLFISGSSAKLLSKEIATSLRGRALSVQVWPFDFYEYLKAKKIKYSAPNTPAKRARSQQYLMDYLACGGFPEITLLDEALRTQILQAYLDTVIFRDMVERYGLTKIGTVKYLLKTLLHQSGQAFAVNKCYNDMKSQGLKIAKNTLHDYLGYIEDAFVVFTVPLFTDSLRKQHSNPRKIYAVDPGLVHANFFFSTPHWGALFENLVYLDLRRHGYEVFYYKNAQGYEVDFVARHPVKKTTQLWQVTLDAQNDAAMEREQRALSAAQRELGFQGEIIHLRNYEEWRRTL